MRDPRRRLMAGFLAVCTAALYAGLVPAGADPGVDLTISSISDTPDPVIEANVVRYKVVASNIGVSDSQAITVYLDAYETEGSFTIASADPIIESASGTGWTCGFSEGWFCTDGTLAAGADSSPLFVYVRAPDHPTTIALSAYVASADSEISYGNNDATEYTDVIQSSTGCEASVSCGSGFIRFDQPSSVTTGPLSATHWLVGTTFFKATSSSGGVVYNMAAVQPTKICVIKCTFQMNIDPIPNVYKAGDVSLVLVCHVSKCPKGRLGLLGLLMYVVGDNGLPLPLLRCVNGLPLKCFKAQRTAAGHLLVTINNLTPGDPKIAGRCLAGC